MKIIGNLFRLYLRSIRNLFGAAVVTFFMLPPCMAALPTIDPPTNTTAGSGLMGTLVGYGFDGFKWMGTILVVAGFIGVGGLLLAQLHAVHSGKKTWGEAGSMFVAGVVVIVALVWMVTKAIETMSAA